MRGRSTAGAWEANAQADACFAILSDPGRAERGWDDEAFFATGAHEIDTFLVHLQKSGIALPARRRALDFGCGVGRLTVALARHFDEVVGVDVSETMVASARERHPLPRVSFELSAPGDLAIVDSGAFDFVYSNIVLQHVAASAQPHLVAELCRVLAPGGVAAFQLPSRRRGWRGAAGRVLPGPAVDLVRRCARPPRLLRREGEVLRMEMNCVPEREVRRIVAAAGAEVVHIVHTNAAEPGFGGDLLLLDERAAWLRARGGGYVSPHYVVRRAP